MNSLQVVFCNIEKLYTDFKSELIDSDGLRPSKSIPRDIFEAVNKFKDHYMNNGMLLITKATISSDILGVAITTDTFATNLRIMREFKFLDIVDTDTCKLTDDFVYFINSNISIEDYFINRLENIKSIRDFEMIYNATLCVLREGYLHGEIFGFPDSRTEFERIFPNQADRVMLCKRVKDVYGFVGRGGDVEQGDYTPNANYRFLTPLMNLGLIERNTTTTNPIRVYELTEKGLLLLKKIDNNLGMGFVNNTMSGIPFQRNRILFGAPGTGKSNMLKENARGYIWDNNTGNYQIGSHDFTGCYERVTFHPNYSYAQFVGTYKPKTVTKTKTVGGVTVTEDEIQYSYVAGPFLRTWMKAFKSYKNDIEPTKYLLIIEEINRANVAAVFGDTFQLLDRDDNGNSEYEIQTSQDLREFLAKEIGGVPSDYETIKIPSNMYIWATMNSADQGVFPVDTAFKRRWSFEYIDINLGELNNDAIVTFPDGRKSKWNDVRHAINDKLAQLRTINEDKFLGPFFLSKSDLLLSNFDSAFKSKLLMYLFEDVIKHKREDFFEEDINTYSKLLNKYGLMGIDVIKDLNLTFIPTTVTPGATVATGTATGSTTTPTGSTTTP
ncbi:AAA family ATPase [Clostridium sp. KNHs214]|uniref:AAA family ATPase n=1 Tax=Clostridium sp. KNHs214 TaxID=1540257 RepID=UPI00068D1040|nr:AAA family ATPase [Clostridium sp. KNHs214]